MVLPTSPYHNEYRRHWPFLADAAIWSAAPGDDVLSPAENAEQLDGALPGPVPRQLRILIIEDNRDYADNLQVLLELMGHQVCLCYTGTEGVETAFREAPDLVVSDIGLPGMHGFEVAQALRGHPSTAGVPLVAVTGYDSDANRNRALECGFNAYFVKPVATAEILKVVQPEVDWENVN